MIKKMNFKEYLLGYLLLVFLGIISNIVYYGALGVSYFQYTSILDVLISPIRILTSNRVLLYFLLGCGLVYFIISWLVPWLLERSKDKNSKKKKTSNWLEKLEILKKPVVLFWSVMLLGFVLIRGIYGVSLHNDIEKGKSKRDHDIIFRNNKKYRVKKVGQNSSYIFYTKKGEKRVSAAPILQNIREIKRVY